MAVYILYTGKYLLCFIFTPYALGRQDWANSVVLNYLSFYTTESRHFPDGVKLFASDFVYKDEK